MSRTQRWLFLGVLPLLVTAALVWWFLSTFHRVSKEIDLPPRGEARYNPLLALRLTLQQQGIQAISRADLDLDDMALQPEDTVVLHSDVRVIDAARTDALLEWVGEGGHLLLRLPEGGDEGRVGPLLERLALTVGEHVSCLDWKTLPPATASGKDATAPAAAGEAGKAEAGKAEAGKAEAGKTEAGKTEAGKTEAGKTEAGKTEAGKTEAGKTDAAAKPPADNDTTPDNGYCSRYRFFTDAEYESDFSWLWGNAKDGFVFGRHDWGDGNLFIAADLDFLTNKELNKDDNAALTWQVLGPALGEGRVFLVYSTDVPPLYVLLVRHGWPLLLALALALAGWLWARSQRLGPLLPLESPHRRALLSHVLAAGEFAFGRARTAALHAAVLRAFLQRLRRRDPVTAALSGEALVLALAQRHEIPPLRVRQALQPQGLGKPDVFLSTIRTLMQLRAKT
ncbi:hypothetical protein DFR29_12712 [Tahibacter aquaticus]|uniref:DUF4350 domain-containing protein n=1 Tax=Tahibacter aquaticus TaxID=520092 RepID=A0A4R6YIP7_9GAMM|nr:DUF4350 domain-containing protein [Tahibacter aquaticus]TDR36662.1 hypothetical protein DFR29_12712 [Tahibacter aquaticus]